MVNSVYTMFGLERNKLLKPQKMAWLVVFTPNGEYNDKSDGS